MSRFALRSLLMVSMALVGSAPVWGAEVSADTAAKIGYAFAQQNALLKEVVTGVGEATAYGVRWVVPLLPQGYVLVESDDTLKPIVAFNTEDFPATENIPEAMAALLYREADATASESSAQSDTPSAVALTIGEEEAVSTTETPHEDWALLSGESSTDEGEIMLLTIDEPTSVKTIRQLTNQTVRWSQFLPYNLYAPGLSEEVMTSGSYETWVNYGYVWSYGSRSPVGCVATATAQVAQFCEWPYRLRTPISSQKSVSDSSLASWQVAVPGEPYDWASIGKHVSESTNGYNDEPYGAEVARLIQHWGTGSSMTYWRSGLGSTTPNAVDDVLEEAFGYQMVASAATWMDDDISEVYAVFRKAVIEYSLPVATGIPGHEVVVAGWAEAVDGTLTPDNCYALVNYGWGNDSTTGWYTLAESSSTASDGDAVLYDAFLRVPLPYGEVTATSGNSVTWYESPYWMNRQDLAPISSRTLRRVAFAPATEGQTVNLSTLASNNSTYWTYDGTNGLTRVIATDVSSSATATETFTGNSLVTIALTRRTDAANSAETWENSGSTLTLQAVSTSDGTVLQESPIQMSSTEITSENVSVALFNIASETSWNLVLATSASSTEAVASIPYYITSITVAGATSDETVSFDLSTDTSCTQSATSSGLYTKTFSSDELTTLASDTRAYYALQVGTTTDWVWSPCLTQAAPTVTWGVGKETETNGWRFWLPTPETEISFTVTDSDSTALSSVTAYLSNTLWLDPAALTSSDGLGIPLTPTSTGDGTWACTFTLPPNPDTSVVDRLSLDSSTAAGRDAMLALKVVDAEGNVTWTHARMTFGIPETALASSTDARDITSAVSALSADNILGTLHVANTSLAYSDLIACYTAAVELRYTESELKTLVATAVAESAGLPAPAVASEAFNGALSPSGFSWGASEQPTTYVTTPFSQGFTISSTESPYVESLASGTTTGVWSAAVVAQGAIALVANVDAVDVTDAPQCVLWDMAPQASSTSTANTLLCVVTADSTGAKVIQLLYIASDASDPIVLQQASIPSNITGYHVITAAFSSSGVTLAVDDQLGTVPEGTTLPSSLTFSLNNFKIGSIYGGTTISGLSAITCATGAIIDELRFYGTALSSATAVYEAVQETLAPANSYARTLAEGANTWSDASWTGTASTFPTDETAGQVTLTADATSTLTVDQAASMTTLILSGAGALTLEGSGSGALSATSTQVGVDTTVSSGVTTLGSVTLGANLTLNASTANSTVVTGLSGTAGNLILDGSNGAFSVDETLRTLIKNYAGTVTLQGDNKVTLAYDPTSDSNGTFGSHLVVASGTHAFSYGGYASVLFASGDTDDKPTIHVKNNATLDFTSKDLTGWEGTLDATGVIRVDKEATLNFLPSGSSTFYYRQRLVMEPGATVTASSDFADNTFRWKGGTGTEATAQIAVLAPEEGSTVTTATFSGEQIYLASDVTAGLGIAVASGAILDLQNGLASASAECPLAKWGAGTLKLSTANTALTSAIALNAGTLQLTDAATLGSGAVTLASGATLDFASSESITHANAIANAGTLVHSGTGTTTLTNLSGAGALQISAGTLALSSASTLTSEVSLSGSGTLALSNGGTFTLTNLSSFTGTLYVTGNTTLDLSGATADLSAITLTVDSGSKVILPSLSTTFAGGSAIASGATVEFALDALTLRLTGGTLATPDYITDGASIVIGSNTYTADGSTLTFTGDATYTGSDWYWDFEFQDASGNSTEDNTGSSATAFTWDGSYPFQESGAYAEITTGNYGLHLQARPYIEAGVPAESTAVARLRAFPSDGKILLSFGSESGGTVTLLTGSDVASTGALRLVHTNTNHEIAAATDFTVPNVTAAYHLYAFTFQTVDGVSQVSLAVDGKVMASLEGLSAIGSAFQFANIYGGLASFSADTGLSSDTAVCTDTTLTEALVDFFRVSEGALSEAALSALAAAYPYVSPNGSATRTVSASEVWSPTDGTTPWTQTDSSGASTAQSAPNSGTVLNLTFSGTATLTQNLSEATTYESLTLTGSGDSATLSITGVTDAAMLTVQGETTLSGGTVTLDASCISLGTLTVEEGAALVLDCSGLDFISGDTLTLTGYVDDASYTRLSVSGLPTEATATPYTWALTHASTGEAQLVPTLKDTVTCFTADIASAGVTFSSLGWTWTIDGTTSTQTTALPAAYTGALVLTNTSGAADASVTIDSARTASSLTVSGAMTLSGLANLTTSGTIALNSSVTLTDTTIAQSLSIAQGCTLTFAPTASATFSGTLSGSGATTIAGDITFTQGQTSFSGALSVSSGTLTFNTSADPTLPYSTLTVAEGATLDLQNAKGYFSVTGQGTLKISGAATLRCATAGNAYNVRNVVIASGATLTFDTTWGQTDLSPVNLTVEGTLTGGDNGVSVSGTLAGSGTIAKVLTLGDGASLTAGSSPLTVSGTLTCSGALAVTLPSGTDFSTANSVTLISGSSVSAPSSATVTLDGATRSDILITTSSAGLIALLPELPTQAEGETASSTLDTTAQAVLREAMVTQNTTTLDKVVGYTKTGKTVDGASAPEAIDTQAINSALTLFTDILTLSTETSGETSVTTAIVTYDFGVTGITVKALDPENTGTSAPYVVLSVAVTDGSTTSTADFADATSVKVTISGTDASGNATSVSATEVTDASGATAFSEGTHTHATGTRYFRVPMASLSGTTSFSVTATNE